MAGLDHAADAKVLQTWSGLPGSVTIMTSNAGRGVDIPLGGDADARFEAALKGDENAEQRETLRRQVKSDVEIKKVAARKAGGLFVFGFERNDSRRIDNRFRAYSGRRGEPGVARFYLSLEDGLPKRFNAARQDAVMRSLGVQEGEAIIHPWMNQALAKRQRQVEAYFHAQQVALVREDDVVSDQREAFTALRTTLVRSHDVADVVVAMADEAVRSLVKLHRSPAALVDAVEEFAGVRVDPPTANERADDTVARLISTLDTAYAQKAVLLGAERRRAVEKQVVLSVCDMRWQEHLQRLDYIRAINRAKSEEEAWLEFQRAAETSFADWLKDIPQTVTRMLLRLQIGSQANETTRPAARASEPREDGFDAQDPKTWGRVARNAPCPCGSGKKYKNCHGAVEAATA